MSVTSYIHYPEEEGLALKKKNSDHNCTFVIVESCASKLFFLDGGRVELCTGKPNTMNQLHVWQIFFGEGGRGVEMQFMWLPG